MKFLAPESYQSQARRLFRSLARRIRSQLGSARIEHIGSSAVAGVWSKGDLDIFVGVDPREFARAKTTLRGMGFVEKRRTLRNASLWPFTARGLPSEVGIQLVANGSMFEFFLTFRDLLRRDARLRSDYNRLKRSCSSLTPAAYRRTKARFITRTLSRARARAAFPRGLQAVRKRKANP